MRYASPLAIAAALAIATPAAAQRTTAGVLAGATHFTSGRSEQALSAVLRFHATPWLSLAINPTWATASDSGGSASGFTDLPLELTLERELHLAWSPSVGFGMNVTLPTGDSASGFGSGKLGYGMMLGLGLSPSERLGLWMGAGRSLRGVAGGSALDASGSWGDAELGYQMTERLRATVGLDGDLGAVPVGMQRAQSAGAGLSLNIGGPYSLTLNASHRVSGEAPVWMMALGFGTEAAEIGHVSGSALSRLGRAFGPGTSSSHGRPTTVGSGRGRP